MQNKYIKKRIWECGCVEFRQIWKSWVMMGQKGEHPNLQIDGIFNMKLVELQKNRDNMFQRGALVIISAHWSL